MWSPELDRQLFLPTTAALGGCRKHGAISSHTSVLAASLTMVSHWLSSDNLGITVVIKECHWVNSDSRTVLPCPPAKGSLLTAPSGPCLVCSKLPKRKSLAIRDMGVAGFGAWRDTGTGGQLRDGEGEVQSEITTGLMGAPEVMPTSRAA